MNLTSLRHSGALLATAALALSLGACETDLDPNDSYKETTFIYAVLDANQPVQRISIQKAFLNTKSNAITIAATRFDSVTFPAGVMQASIEILNRRDSVVIGSPYPLTAVVNTVKGEGPFARIGQMIYQTPDGFPRLDAADTTKLYRVVARNLRTGTVATSVTDLPIVLPNTQQATYPYLHFLAAGRYIPASQLATVFGFDPGAANQSVAVALQRRAVVYSIEVDFHYKEVFNGVQTPKTLTWTLTTNEQKEYSPLPVSVSTPVLQNAFFTQFLNKQINPATDPAGLRRVIADTALTWRATAGSPQWARYQEIMSSSSALTQTTPEFTNVRGGRGLVTGRSQTRIYQRINPAASVSPDTKLNFKALNFDL